jgi:uncharacterized protein YbjT (DUF2867 family)
MFLVVGATGDLGGRVVRRLLERREPVRCMIRAQTDAGELEALGAEIVRGDLSDHASLPLACAGVTTVVATATAIGRRLTSPGGPSIKNVDEVGMAALIDAAENSAVERFVYVSYAGADFGLNTPLERAKVATEKRLGSSTMQVTVVRPDAFQEIHLAPIGRFDMRAGKVAVFGRGDTRRRWVSTDDVAALVADVAVAAVAPPLIEFGGPEAISRNEAIAVAERLTGRTMKVQRMPRWAARLGMRLLDRPKDGLASVFGAGLLQDLVESRWDDGPLRERGIEPRSATAFLEEQARLTSSGDQ